MTIGAKWTKNKVQYQQETMQNQQYNQMVLYTDAALNIGKHFTISSTIDYTHYSATSFSAALDLPIWEGAIAIHFLENQRGTLKLSGQDLLNKNQGINRISQFNFVQEERIISLGRYFLLQFTYALSGFNSGEDGIQIMRQR